MCETRCGSEHTDPHAVHGVLLLRLWFLVCVRVGGRSARGRGACGDGAKCARTSMRPMLICTVGADVSASMGNMPSNPKSSRLFCFACVVSCCLVCVFAVFG